MTEKEIKTPGFLAAGISAGIKETGAKDLSLIYSEAPARAAGVFTTNAFPAAPVLVSRQRLRSGYAQAILTNSGNANAATGEDGYRDALDMGRTLARCVNIHEDHVLVSSTGVIGHRLPLDRIQKAMPRLVAGLRPEGIGDAEEAILTTDRFPKLSFRKRMIGGREITVCGMAKGAGMIQPHMATMLAYVMTDADVDAKALDRAFRYGVGRSFNAISVDGCMSTNDTALILANGVAGNRRIEERGRDFIALRGLLTEVMTELAKDMVRDGEGATKVLEITVEGARTVGEARKMAYAIANSNLVKTAFHGGDPNWGRIVAAAGAVGVPLSIDSVELSFDGVPLFRQGRKATGNEDILKEIMSREEIGVRFRAGMGNRSFRVFASDLGFGYIEVNAHYHT
ncbi:MAG: bifunctional glutamate N-acetyltransferase/amino-acid acetyltransferase ArgJ [Pseudomonadota bacterium]|nr:bifunctional glutamate N-acetyltransferase/amino-acid acetyltransferase ArgJ [Pseudomonadota bacterium]